jgi:MtN3 and saliva related transmembrane protein
MGELIGVAAAACTSFAFIPQIIKVAKSRSVKNVSFLTLLQFVAGISLWVVYGVVRNDSIIIAANGVSLASLFILIYLYACYRNGGKT